MTSDSTLGIGDASRALSTTPRTLRYYEQRGLLGPIEVTDSGHRRYDAAALDRARRVLQLRNLGLPLDDIDAALRGDEARLTEILTAQAAVLDNQLAELGELSKRLHALLGRDLTSPPADPPGGANESLDLLEELSMKIVLSRIYTRTGDHGTTALADGVRVEKTDPLLEAIGDVDELITTLGLAIAAAPETADALHALQNELFNLGADLARAERDTAGAESALVSDANIRRLEQWCDDLNAELEPPASFVLPGGNAPSSALHHARAVCRRAERHCWAVSDARTVVPRYLNRLSDLLFLLARSAESAEEPTWTVR